MRFHINSSTIRRDLERLAVQGQLRRVYGGAITLEAPSDFCRELGDEARRVGQTAADLVRVGVVRDGHDAGRQAGDGAVHPYRR